MLPALHVIEDAVTLTMTSAAVAAAASATMPTLSPPVRVDGDVADRGADDAGSVARGVERRVGYRDADSDGAGEDGRDDGAGQCRVDDDDCGVPRARENDDVGANDGRAADVGERLGASEREVAGDGAVEHPQGGADGVGRHADGAGRAFDDERDVFGGDGEPQVGAADGVGVGSHLAVHRRAGRRGGTERDGEREGEREKRRFHGVWCVVLFSSPRVLLYHF